MVKIRNYRESDFKAYRDLYRLVDWEDDVGAELCELKLNKPRCVPQKDLYLAELSSRELVGFADITNEIKIGRIITEEFIRPEYRRQGIGSRMMTKVRDRAEELGAQCVQVYVDADTAGSRGFLKYVGFNPVREYLELEWNADESEKEKKHPEELAMSSFSEGDEQTLADIQNKVFYGSWGFCPNSADDINYYLAMTNCCMSDVLRFHKHEETVGYLWPRLISDRNQAGIHMMGLLPKFRGNRLGTPLLENGLSHLTAKGYKQIDLTVDAQNLPAISLYRTLKFKQKSKKLWYELTMLK